MKARTALLLMLLLPLIPTHVQTPQYQTDQPRVTQALNDFWTLQGLGRPTVGVRANWQALLGSSDWYEWNSLKINWSGDAADKAAQRNLLLNAKIDGINATGTQAAGYVWPSNGSEWWLCPSPHFDQMPRFVCAVYNDYLWSRDGAFLRRMRPRVEAVMDYMADTMHGRGALPVCPGVYTGLSNAGPNTTYMDCYREGHCVTWIAEEYDTALRDMAALETALGDRARAAVYAAEAQAFPARFDAQLWNPRTRRYAGWRDQAGALHDYGFTYLNLEALARGLGGASQAGDIFDWLDHGTAWPTVMGGHVGSRDIYQCVVAPRSNTVPMPAADWDPWSVPPSLRRSTMGYGALVEDGGAMLWVNYYDVIARLRWLDADSAWSKLTGLLYRVQGDPLRFTEDVHHPRNVYGEHYLEVGPADGPENGLAGTSPLYGFLGIQPHSDGLYATPNLPTSLLFLESRRVCYGSAVCTLRVSRGRIIAQTTAALFTAGTRFNKVGIRLARAPSPGSRLAFQLQKQMPGLRGVSWALAASASVPVPDRETWCYVPVPVQTAGTYRILLKPGDGRPACRAVYEPALHTAAGALHGADTAFTAGKAFSRLMVRAHVLPIGPVTLSRRLGSHWRPVATTWTVGTSGGVLGFADQPPGAYRLRFPASCSGTYELLSGRYTVETTNGIVTSTATVPAGESAKLNVIPGAPVGHRIVLHSPARGHDVTTDRNGLIAQEEPQTRAMFDVCDAGHGTVALRSVSHGRYISVVSGGRLQAGPTTIGPSERFVWRNQLSGAFALDCPAVHRYVSADLSHGGRLVASFATTAGDWEQFTWTDEGLSPTARPRTVPAGPQDSSRRSGILRHK